MSNPELTVQQDSDSSDQVSEGRVIDVDPDHLHGGTVTQEFHFATSGRQRPKPLSTEEKLAQEAAKHKFHAKPLNKKMFTKPPAAAAEHTPPHAPTVPKPFKTASTEEWKAHLAAIEAKRLAAEEEAHKMSSSFKAKPAKLYPQLECYVHACDVIFLFSFLVLCEIYALCWY